MTSFVLKIIAIISMFFDHIGYVIFRKLSFFNYIGRLAFPIFAFQITEGYTHTKDLKKYFFRLIMFAFISQIPFMLFVSFVENHSVFHNISLNIFFTLLLGLLAIFFYDKMKYKILGLVIAGSLAIIGEFLNVDYGYWGVLVVFFFYVFRNSKIMSTLSFLILILIKYIPIFIKTSYNNTYILIALFTFLSIIPILLYNKKQGKKLKYFLYLFYPIHLLLFYCLTLII